MPNRPTETNTSERRLEAIEKQAQALELRKAGVSFPNIAKALGYGGPSGAYNAVHSAIRRVLREPVEALVNMEMARLDDIAFALWPAVKRGEEKASARMLDVMTRRAKMLGLDAPAKLEHAGKDGAPLTFSIKVETNGDSD